MIISSGSLSFDSLVIIFLKRKGAAKVIAYALRPGRGGGGLKIGKILRTYFMDDPLKFANFGLHSY